MFGSDKSTLLKLLQDAEVQRAIIAILETEERRTELPVEEENAALRQDLGAEQTAEQSLASSAELTIVEQQEGASAVKMDARKSSTDDAAPEIVAAEDESDQGKKKWHKKYDELLSQYEALQKECSVANDKYMTLELAHNTLKQQAVELQQSYQRKTTAYDNLHAQFTSQQDSYDAMRRESFSFKQRYEAQKDKYNKIAAKLKRVTSVAQKSSADCQALQQQLQSAAQLQQQYKDDADQTKEQLQGQVQDNQALREQLAQRFDKGWQLYEKYGRVSANTRQLLGSVFTGTDFMSFICGGAQNESLSKIWDVVKYCLLHDGYEDDAAILWNIFEYCLQLVNASKTQTIYEIAKVTQGDAFDVDVHTPAGNSRAQGRVQEIYLQGYINVYSHKMERKSIVNIG